MTATTTSTSPAPASTPPEGLPAYRLLTGPDDASFCRRVSDALALVEAAKPEPGDGEIVIRNAMLSMDAGTRMWLTDRTDVYVHKDDGAWYDEMLVEGERIIVTAYSYGNQATEISIFRLDQTSGGLSREGRFFLNSYDYYSGENYASRIFYQKVQTR